MSDTVSGLLTQKPDSPAPNNGEVKNFTVEQRPKKSGEGTWNKLKNEREGFGSAYKILKSEQLDDYTHPQHGTFHQFSLLLEPASEGAGSGAANGSSPSSAKDEDIARAVAFKGAVEIYAAHGKAPENDAHTAIAIGSLTTALLPIVKGETDEAPPTEPSGDSDIPF